MLSNSVMKMNVKEKEDEFRGIFVLSCLDVKLEVSRHQISDVVVVTPEFPDLKISFK